MRFQIGPFCIQRVTTVPGKISGYQCGYQISKIAIYLIKLLNLISIILKSGGGTGIRTLDRLLTYAGFQDRCIQPLCHPSAA